MRKVLQLQRSVPLFQLLALCAVAAYGFITIEGLAQWPSVKLLLVLASFLALASLGQTLVIIIGGIDFAVPGYIVLGAVTVSRLYGVDHWPPLLAVAAPIVLAGLLGGLTGWVCHRYFIQPLVFTLGAGALVSGAVIGWTGADLSGRPPEVVSRLASPASILPLRIDIPPIVAITGLVTVVVAVGLHRTVPGRKLYATGASPRAARLALVSTTTVWACTFAISAAVAAAVGVLLAGFSGPSATLGDSYLFTGLTAVIVGGTTFRGSRGDFTHTLVGALLLTFITTILVGNDVSPAVNQILFGVLILLVVAGFGRERRLRDAV